VPSAPGGWSHRKPAKAIWIGAVIVAIAALVAHAIPRLRPSKERLAPALEKA
jgi:hypothetical protein